MASKRPLRTKFIFYLILSTMFLGVFGSLDTYRVANNEIKLDLLLRSKILTSSIHHSSMIADNLQEIEHVAEQILSSNPVISTLIILPADRSEAIYEVHTKSYSKEISLLLKHAAKSVLKDPNASARWVENNYLFSIVPVINDLSHTSARNVGPYAGHVYPHGSDSLKPGKQTEAGTAKEPLNSPKTIVANDVISSAIHVGAVLFAFDEQIVQAEIFSLVWRIIPTTFTGVSLMILLCYLFLDMLVIKPIGAIKSTMVRQQQGDEAARAPAHSSFEIDVMSNTLNRMLDDMQEHENVIKAMAMTDSLTGLANRAMFARKLESAIKNAILSGQTFAVFYIDLDKFKLINDQYGHLAGDKMLQEAAKVLKEHIREEDTVARLGGDEFAILLRSPADTAAAAVVANRLLGLLSEPVRIGDEEVFPSASIG
ncbi:MAG: diguanylate cyclase, partial [Pseudomonadales bacterium]|nr:diguanylate cyclase [Pseudomonadales bacterium]